MHKYFESNSVVNIGDCHWEKCIPTKKGYLSPILSKIFEVASATFVLSYNYVSNKLKIVRYFHIS